MNRFDGIPFDEEVVTIQRDLRDKFKELATKIESALPRNRCASKALNRLEESFMWAGKGMRDLQIDRNKRSHKESEE